MNNDEQLEYWHKEANEFTGNKALFWAGRMATATKMVEASNTYQLSANIKLLVACMHEYDKEIMSRI